MFSLVYQGLGKSKGNVAAYLLEVQTLSESEYFGLQ